MKLNVLFACAVACALSVCTAGDFDDAKPEPAGKKPAAAAKGKPAGAPKKAGAKDAAADKDAKAKDAAKDAKAPAGKDAKAKPGAKDEKAPAAKDAGETRPEPTEAERAKAIKNKKPFYTKLAEGRAVAWKCGLPLLVACAPAGTPASQAFEGKILKHKAFMKEFVPQNAVLVIWRLKQGKVEEPPQRGRRRNNNAPRPLAKTIDTRPIKGDDLAFLKQYAPAKPAVNFDAMANYPTLICLDHSGKKLLFRMPQYKTGEAGAFGLWFSQLVDFYRAAGIEPKLTPFGQKICEHPQEPKKWK